MAHGGDPFGRCPWRLDAAPSSIGATCVGSCRWQPCDSTLPMPPPERNLLMATTSTIDAPSVGTAEAVLLVAAAAQGEDSAQSAAGRPMGGASPTVETHWTGAASRWPALRSDRWIETPTRSQRSQDGLARAETRFAPLAKKANLLGNEQTRTSQILPPRRRNSFLTEQLPVESLKPIKGRSNRGGLVAPRETGGASPDGNVAAPLSFYNDRGRRSNVGTGGPNGRRNSAGSSRAHSARQLPSNTQTLSRGSVTVATTSSGIGGTSNNNNSINKPFHNYPTSNKETDISEETAKNGSTRSQSAILVFGSSNGAVRAKDTCEAVCSQAGSSSSSRGGVTAGVGRDNARQSCHHHNNYNNNNNYYDGQQELKSNRSTSNRNRRNGNSGGRYYAGAVGFSPSAGEFHQNGRVPLGDIRVQMAAVRRQRPPRLTEDVDSSNRRQGDSTTRQRSNVEDHVLPGAGARRRTLYDDKTRRLLRVGVVATTGVAAHGSTPVSPPSDVLRKDRGPRGRGSHNEVAQRLRRPVDLHAAANAERGGGHRHNTASVVTADVRAAQRFAMLADIDSAEVPRSYRGNMVASCHKGGRTGVGGGAAAKHWQATSSGHRSSSAAAVAKREVPSPSTCSRYPERPVSNHVTRVTDTRRRTRSKCAPSSKADCPPPQRDFYHGKLPNHRVIPVEDSVGTPSNDLVVVLSISKWKALQQALLAEGICDATRLNELLLRTDYEGSSNTDQTPLQKNEGKNALVSQDPPHLVQILRRGPLQQPPQRLQHRRPASKVIPRQTQQQTKVPERGKVAPLCRDWAPREQPGRARAVRESLLLRAILSPTKKVPVVLKAQRAVGAGAASNDSVGHTTARLLRQLIRRIPPHSRHRFSVVGRQPAGASSGRGSSPSSAGLDLASVSLRRRDGAAVAAKDESSEAADDDDGGERETSVGAAGDDEDEASSRSSRVSTARVVESPRAATEVAPVMAPLCIALPPRNLDIDFSPYGYEHVHLLSHGSVGCAHVVRRHGGLWVAKVVDLTRMAPEEAALAQLEAEFLQRLNHPFILRFHESFRAPRTLIIITEFCQGGDLFSRVEQAAVTSGGQDLSSLLRSRPRRRSPRAADDSNSSERFDSGAGDAHSDCDDPSFSAQQIVQWITQLALGLQYMHSKRILHCDLKSSNVFLTRGGTAKIGDLGIAREMRSDCSTKMLSSRHRPRGTPIYMSPELCRGSDVTDKADSWALGCILYELVFKKHAFSDWTRPSLVSAGVVSTLSSSVIHVAQDIQRRMPEVLMEIERFGVVVDQHAQEGAVEATGDGTSCFSARLIHRLLRALLQPCPEARLSLQEVLEILYSAEYLPDNRPGAASVFDGCASGTDLDVRSAPPSLEDYYEDLICANDGESDNGWASHVAHDGNDDSNAITKETDVAPAPDRDSKTNERDKVVNVDTTCNNDAFRNNNNNNNTPIEDDLTRQRGNKTTRESSADRDYYSAERATRLSSITSASTPSPVHRQQSDPEGAASVRSSVVAFTTSGHAADLYNTFRTDSSPSCFVPTGDGHGSALPLEQIADGIATSASDQAVGALAGNHPPGNVELRSLDLWESNVQGAKSPRLSPNMAQVVAALRFSVVESLGGNVAAQGDDSESKDGTPVTPSLPGGTTAAAEPICTTQGPKGATPLESCGNGTGALVPGVHYVGSSVNFSSGQSRSNMLKEATTGRRRVAASTMTLGKNGVRSTKLGAGGGLSLVERSPGRGLWHCWPRLALPPRAAAALAMSKASRGLPAVSAATEETNVCVVTARARIVQGLTSPQLRAVARYIHELPQRQVRLIHQRNAAALGGPFLRAAQPPPLLEAPAPLSGIAHLGPQATPSSLASAATALTPPAPTHWAASLKPPTATPSAADAKLHNDSHHAIPTTAV